MRFRPLLLAAVVAATTGNTLTIAINASGVFTMTAGTTD
jgi:hypothetical protein